MVAHLFDTGFRCIRSCSGTRSCPPWWSCTSRRSGNEYLILALHINRRLKRTLLLYYNAMLAVYTPHDRSTLATHINDDAADVTDVSKCFCYIVHIHCKRNIDTRVMGACRNLSRGGSRTARTAKNYLFFGAP